MRFFIAAVVAFATMTFDFESFKLNYGLQGTTRGAFTVAAGHAGEEDKVEPAEHSLGAEAAVHPVETNGPSVDSEPVAEIEAATPEPKKDFCDALREAAESSDIPIAFFARLLWQESRFQAFEVSRVGAQGVAQFMPATAAEVGLDDPFDPFKAMPASARFLRKLHDEFGNLGLAAAAYNAGSGRIQKWLSGRSALPRETRDYVRIITGNNAQDRVAASGVTPGRALRRRGRLVQGKGSRGHTGRACSFDKRRDQEGRGGSAASDCRKAGGCRQSKEQARAVGEEEITQGTGKQPRGAETRHLAVRSRQALAISSYCLGKTSCALPDQSGATISSSRRDMTGGLGSTP